MIPIMGWRQDKHAGEMTHLNPAAVCSGSAKTETFG